jgi:hypothetical protein
MLVVEPNGHDPPRRDLMSDPDLLDDEVPDDDLLDAVRRADAVHDPVPPGLVDRMVAVTRDVAESDPDLELELLLVVERFDQLVGTRGGARSYTLRFGGQGIDLLVRVGVSDEEGRARLDGWVVPAAAGTVSVHEVGGAGRRYAGTAAETGRFEFPDLPTGFYRVSLALAGELSFGTPAFEI